MLIYSAGGTIVLSGPLLSDVFKYWLHYKHKTLYKDGVLNMSVCLFKGVICAGKMIY